LLIFLLKKRDENKTIRELEIRKGRHGMETAVLPCKKRNFLKKIKGKDKKMKYLGFRL
jgi:hypothetical protein